MKQSEGGKQEPGVYFATDKEEALYYLNLSKAWNEKVALVEFDVDMNKATFDKKNAEQFGSKNSYYIQENIPPENIQSISILSTDSNPREGSFHVTGQRGDKSIYNFILEKTYKQIRKGYVVILVEK